MKKPIKKEKVKVSILTLLDEKVDIGKIIDSIPLHEAQLIDAALEQPSLTMQAGTARVQSYHKRTLLESRLKLFEAQAGLRLRRIRDGGGRKEFTEGAVKERIQLQTRVRKVRKRLDIALAEEKMCELLSEVIRTRSDAIRNIVNAGKVSVHAKELQILRSSKTLSHGVRKLRDRWEKEDDN